MTKPGHTGLERILRATVHSIRGLSAAWRHESAFRQELAAIVVLVPVALWLGQSPVEKLLLIVSLLLVLAVELLNSAVEAAIDRFGDEIHELSGRAKDLSSAAVLISLVIVLLVWGVIAWQRFAT